MIITSLNTLYNVLLSDIFSYVYFFILALIWLRSANHTINEYCNVLSGRRLGKPECQKCCNETANIQFAIDSDAYSIIDYSL